MADDDQTQPDVLEDWQGMRYQGCEKDYIDAGDALAKELDTEREQHADRRTDLEFEYKTRVEAEQRAEVAEAALEVADALSEAMTRMDAAIREYPSDVNLVNAVAETTGHALDAYEIARGRKWNPPPDGWSAAEKGEKE